MTEPRRIKRYGKKAAKYTSYYIHEELPRQKDVPISPPSELAKAPLGEADGNRRASITSHETTKPTAESFVELDIKPNRASSSCFSRDLLDYLRPIANCGAPISEWTTWRSFAQKIRRHKLEIKKLGEGSFCEVYHIKGDDSTRIFKAIPIKPRKDKTVSGRLEVADMTSVDDVAAELTTLERLQVVSGFVEITSFKVIHGSPCAPWTDARKDWWTDRSGDTSSIYPDPRSQKPFDADQIWVGIEMEYAGRSLSHIKTSNPLVYWDIFWRLCKSLAEAEDLLQFEHRDLHTGNVCVREASDFTEIFNKAQQRNPSSSTTEGAVTIGLSGYYPTVIDCTLSRSSAPEDPSKRSVSTGDAPGDVWSNLEKSPFLFEGGKHHQHDIYIWMRSWVLYGDRHTLYRGKESRKCLGYSANQGPGGGNWSQFQPLTNVFWLYALLEKMLGRLSNTETENTGDPYREFCSDTQMISLRERAQAAMVKLYSQLRAEIESGNANGDAWLDSAKAIGVWGVQSGYVSKHDLEADDYE